MWFSDVSYENRGTAEQYLRIDHCRWKSGLECMEFKKYCLPLCLLTYYIFSFNLIQLYNVCMYTKKSMTVCVVCSVHVCPLECHTYARACVCVCKWSHFRAHPPPPHFVNRLFFFLLVIFFISRSNTSPIFSAENQAINPVSLVQPACYLLSSDSHNNTATITVYWLTSRKCLFLPEV